MNQENKMDDTRKRKRMLHVDDFIIEDPLAIKKAVEHYLLSYTDNGKDVSPVGNSIIISCKCWACKKVHNQDIEIDVYKPWMDVYCREQYDPVSKEKIADIYRRVPHPYSVFTNYLSGDVGLASIFIDSCKNDIVISNTKSVAGYVWNPDTTLWEAQPRHYIEPLVSLFFKQRFECILAFCLGCGLRPKDRKRKIPMHHCGIDHAGEFVSLIQATMKHIERISGARAIFAQAMPQLTIHDFEAKINNIPHLFPIRDHSVVDLRTGLARPRYKEDLFSFECPVTLVHGPHKIAEEFYKQIMLRLEYNDTNVMISATPCLETVDYMQRFGGYQLTGSMGERSMYQKYGIGANGKGTEAKILAKIMGGFYTQASKDIFVKTNSRSAGAATSHTVPLIGKRIGVCAETDAGDTLNEGFLKGYSHGDLQTVRPLYGPQFTVAPSAKLIVETNVRIKFNLNDQAVHDSMVLLPYNARFVLNPTKPNDIKRDVDYAETLLDEDNVNHFFSWYVKGAVRWYAGEKLIPTGIIKDAMASYVNELDEVLLFITEHCTIGTGKRETTSSIYTHYRDVFCKNEAKTPMSKGAFTDMLAKKGYPKIKSSTYFYIGLELNITI
jgi:P4 family phage/plasmid primase-like protien